MPDIDPNGIGQHESGAKLDAGKVDASLLGLFARALYQVLLVGTMGAEKYTYAGFLDVEDGVRRYTAAMQRHYFMEEMEGIFDKDPWSDPPEGKKWKDKIRHDAQAAWNALARVELRLREEEKAKKDAPANS